MRSDIMNDYNKEETLATLSDTKEVGTFDLNDDDDDMDIDVRSSTDSHNTPTTNHEIGHVSNENLSSIRTPKVESIDGIENKIPTDDSSSSKIDDHVERNIPRSVYNYATIFQQTLEIPYQNRLDQDVVVVHGSSDPPPGFGFLQPRLRYLHQKRPIPLEPLPVWRGYNGNVYFSPIQVQQLEGDRPTSHTKSLKSASTQNILSTKKTGIEQLKSILPTHRIKKSITHKNNNDIKERNNSGQRAEVKIITNGKIKSSNNQFKNHTLDASNDEEDNNQEPTKMCQSGFTSSHSRIRRMLKRSQHNFEDLQQDQTSHNRQVLPNLRLVSKSKYVHKGLAYKESQRLPSVENAKRNDNDSIDFTRYGIKHPRVQQLPSITSTGTVSKDQLSQLHTSFDFREIRKRIVKGSTVTYRTPIQSTVWTPNQNDNGSILSSQMLVPIQTLTPFNHVSLSFVSTLHQQKPKTTHTTSNLSQYFEISSTDNNINIQS